MKLIKSKQVNVSFSFCKSPVVIDKSADWGEGSKQVFDKGVFFKHDEDGTISHGVQPNKDQSAPLGWIPNDSGSFDKAPIFLGEKMEVGTVKTLKTLNGIINYDITESAYVVYQDLHGKPDENDPWVITEKKLHTLYHVDL